MLSEKAQAEVARYKEISQGHADLWECTKDEFIKQVCDILKEQAKRNRLKPKVVTMAAQFLLIKFEKKELKGTAQHEVTKAVEESLIYFVNVLGEEV